MDSKELRVLISDLESDKPSTAGLKAMLAKMEQ